jgi:triosephosphate isomerase
MRKNIVAGNWKMNGDYDESMLLFQSIALRSNEFPDNVEVMVAPAYLYLKSMTDLNNNQITLTAQNCADKESGAYTGEISVGMLKSVGVKHVLVGHSERRLIYGETIRDISEKVVLVLQNDMIPVFCVGEELNDRQKGQHFDVIEKQLISIFNLAPELFEKVIVAYEPVWAIGTGETATPEQAQQMHAFIREKLVEVYGSLAQQTRILYGGSVKPDNASELFSKLDVDGGLVGGASLNADDFLIIIKAAGA